jgi:N-formylmaleamate deformylase
MSAVGRFEEGRMSSPVIVSLLLLAATTLGVATPAGAGQPPATPGTDARPAFQVMKAGTGRAMILIPGLMSSGAVWEGAVERFKARYECHVLTLAGFAGQPPLAPPFDATGFLDTVRRDLVRYIQTNRLDRPILVGHSLGAFLAFAVASAYPELVGPVIAIDGVPFFSALMNPAADADSVRAQAQQMRELYASLTPAQLTAQSKLSLGSMMKNPADVERAVAWASASDPKTIGVAMYEMMTTDLRNEVEAITSPVLLIGAAAFAQDAETRARVKAAYERQVAKVPNHRVVIADEARHFIMFDTPDFLWTSIEAFLASVKPASPPATPSKGAAQVQAQATAPGKGR